MTDSFCEIDIHNLTIKIFFELKIYEMTKNILNQSFLDFLFSV